MKAWPKVLGERYPVGPGALVERPWWSSGRPTAPERYPGLVRGGVPHWYEDWGRDDGASFASASVDAPGERERIDREYPIPFPGLRVGQTWATVDGERVSVFTITEYDPDNEVEVGSRHFNQATDRVCQIRAGGSGPVIGTEVYRRRPWHVGGAWITEPELLDLCKGGYLLADVVCPWLAPWAGVEP